MITAGLENPTPDVSKAIVEAEASGKGRCSKFLLFTNIGQNFLFSSFSNYFYHYQQYMFSDANMKPADNLIKLAAMGAGDLRLGVSVRVSFLMFNNPF